jgi:molybdopterin-binding protein
MADTTRYTLGEAAGLIGVSLDTLRRWDRDGKLRTERDARNHRLVPAEEVQRLARHPHRHQTGVPLSARNHLTGTIRSVEVDGVMALVELETDVRTFLITAAITRDSVEELGLAAGVEATATVKATSVMIQR